MSGICAFCGRPGVLGKRDDGRYKMYHAHCEAILAGKREARNKQRRKEQRKKTVIKYRKRIVTSEDARNLGDEIRDYVFNTGYPVIVEWHSERKP